MSSLVQLQDLASRQQQQIESTHRVMVSKEHRLSYLSTVFQDQQSGDRQSNLGQSDGQNLRNMTGDYEASLAAAKERLALQEAKIRQLQLMRAQIGKQRGSNSNMCTEVETIKILYREKERELTAAVGKIDALTRQLEELKRGNFGNSYSFSKNGAGNENANNGNSSYSQQQQQKQQAAAELEKLRQELLHKNKVAKQQDEELLFKRKMLYKRQADMLQIEQKVTELRSRLARKRQLNAQQMSCNNGTGSSTSAYLRTSGPTKTTSNGQQTTETETNRIFNPKTVLRSSIGGSGQSQQNTSYKVPYAKPNNVNANSNSNSSQLSPNIATVEPLQRLKQQQQGTMLKQFDFAPPMDSLAGSKYQTLPYSTKLNGRPSSDNQNVTKNGGQHYQPQFDHQHYNHYNPHHHQNNSVPPTSNDNISLIIGDNNHLNHLNHHRQKSLDSSLGKGDEQEDNSLEERPSPSGSSGSSDRISSSMTSSSAYDVYGDGLNKMMMMQQENNNNTNFYSNSANYVPASKSVNSSNSTIKPSAPVKPNSVSNRESEPSDCVDNVSMGNNRYDHHHQQLLYGNGPSREQKSQFRSSSAENSTLSTPTSGVYSSSDIFSSHGSEEMTGKGSCLSESGSSDLVTMEFEDIEDDDDYAENRRNQELEEGGSENRSRSTSVSEIVSRINKWSVTGSGQQSTTETADWEKTKRRPVILSSNGEMEKELSKEVSSSSSSPKNKPSGDGKESSPEKRNKTSSILQQQDLANNNNSSTTETTSADDVNGNGNNNKTNATTNNTTSKLNRIKGSLKKGGKENNSNNSNKKKAPLGRRVSFDPLALLLDAALEGELELVRKTSQEVPNPSASNDESITALHNATCAGHFDIVQYLVEIGCDVNAQDNDGWTPLHCAASCNNLPMIRYLVGAGACPFAATFSDRETAAEKCEEDEDGFDGCSQYLFGIQEQIGSINGGLVYAQYDYEAVNDDELSFKVGDRVQVLRKVDEVEKGWWWAKKVPEVNSSRKEAKQETEVEEGFIPRNLFALYPRIEPSYHHHLNRNRHN